MFYARKPTIDDSNKRSLERFGRLLDANGSLDENPSFKEL
jgi:hypothetical protein